MWSQTLGHEKRIAEFKKAIAGGRLAHGYLFSGPEGIGKKRVALGLAMVLGCQVRSEARSQKPDIPCGECHACKKIVKGIHPDVHLIQPENQTIKIETIRELKKKIVLHSMEGKAKVVLIDDAESMTVAAANAILKMLEEPPANTYFFLISHCPNRLLPTILSRLVKVDFSPLSITLLGCQLEKEKGWTTQESLEVARLSQGSLGRALSYEPSLLAEIREEMASLERRPSTARILELADHWAGEGEPNQILDILSYLWAEKIKAKGHQKLLDDFQNIQRAYRALEGHAHKVLLYEDLLFQMTRHDSL